jgi:hypothetical protein
VRDYTRHTVITTRMVLRMDTKGASPMRRVDLYALLARMDNEVRKAEGMSPGEALPDNAYEVSIHDSEIELSHEIDREVRNG